MISPAVTRTMQQVGVTDPSPTHARARRRRDQQVIASPRPAPVWPAAAGVNPSLPAPKIDYGLAMPMLIVFGAAMVGVLVEAFAPRARRYAVQLVVSIGGLLAAFVAVLVAPPTGTKGAHRVGLDRHRRADAVPAGHDARC